MDLGPLLRAIRDLRPGGAQVREWSIFAQQARRIALGIKDREIGNPHAPLRLSESCGATYRLIWSDGLLSRGHIERRQLEFDTESALDGARAAAYEDPDASWVLGPATIPEVEIHDPETAAIAGGDTEIFNEPVFPKGEQRGFGIHEAPRGTLSHWVVIRDGKIANYQAVVPTTWNASPRDENGQVGPYEASLIGNPIADPEKPLEVLRTVHSFDPCLACAIHTVDVEGKEISTVRTV